MVQNFQALVFKYFSMHQPFNFCIQEVHALLHLENYIRIYGNLRKLDVGMYENSNFSFKEKY